MTGILRYIKPMRAKIGLGLTIKFFGTIMDLLIPMILALMIDEIVPTKNKSMIVLYGLMMIGCAALGVLSNVIANRMAARVARETTRNIRHDLFRKVSYLSSSQMDSFTVPSLVSRLTSDTYHIHHMVGMMQRLGVRAPILLLGGIIVTMSLDPMLSIVLISILPFIGLIVYGISKKGIPLFSNLQKSVDNLVRVVRENVTGIRVIKALSKGDYERERFKAVNSEVVRKEKRVGMTMAITSPSMNFLLNIGLTLVLLVGAFRINSGLSKPGSIIAFLTYFTIILNAMLSISRIFILTSRGSASFGRIEEILNAPEELILEDIEQENTEYHIVFEDVSFSYHKQTYNLSNIEFRIRKGDTLGIIGPTGSGKSSIIRLLLRLYDVDKGRVLINGRNVKSIPHNELHQMFGIVFQNDVLFADTIAENIAFGRNIPFDDILQSSGLAQAGEFIDSLPDGLNHKLNVKAANLSGGQKQRILISRALASNPQILVLDDSSSALDYKTDAKLRQSLKDAYKDTTTIIIAQRISSIMQAEHILVLDDGKIVGSGNHSHLLETCPQYRAINELQMGGVK